MVEKYSIQIMTMDKAHFYSDMILEIYSKSLGESKENWNRSNVLMNLPKKWELSLLLFRDTSLIGFLLSSCYNDHIAHIHQISIYPEFHQQGLGTKLIQYYIELLKNKTIKMITLECLIREKEVTKFYENMGFIKVLDDNLMHKYLTGKNKLDKKEEYYPINQMGKRLVYMMALASKK